MYNRRYIDGSHPSASYHPQRLVKKMRVNLLAVCRRRIMELANIAYSTKNCNEGSKKEAPQELAICSYNGEVPAFGSYARERGRERDSITVELKERRDAAGQR